MGLFKDLFGKKIEITVTDENGVSRTKQVLKSDLEQWERDGKITKMKTIRVNIAGLNGVRIEEWTIGTEVQKESIDKFADKSTGELYIGEHYKEGKPIKYFMMKEAWEDYKNI